MFHSLAAVLVLLLSACEEPANRAQTGQPEPAPAARAAPSSPAPAPPRAPPASDPSIAAAARAALAEMFVYSEGTFAIVREHRKDCDAMAAGLAERAPIFRELAPRMMAIKEQMGSLPVAEREAIKREADREAERFRARVPDIDDLERVARECEKSSPAFARVAPQVMFTKKK